MNLLREWLCIAISLTIVDADSPNTTEVLGALLRFVSIQKSLATDKAIEPKLSALDLPEKPPSSDVIVKGTLELTTTTAGSGLPATDLTTTTTESGLPATDLTKPPGPDTIATEVPESATAAPIKTVAVALDDYSHALGEALKAAPNEEAKVDIIYDHVISITPFEISKTWLGKHKEHAYKYFFEWISNPTSPFVDYLFWRLHDSKEPLTVDLDKELNALARSVDPSVREDLSIKLAEHRDKNVKGLVELYVGLPLELFEAIKGKTEFLDWEAFFRFAVKHCGRFPNIWEKITDWNGDLKALATLIINMLEPGERQSFVKWFTEHTRAHLVSKGAPNLPSDLTFGLGNSIEDAVDNADTAYMNTIVSVVKGAYPEWFYRIFIEEKLIEGSFKEVQLAMDNIDSKTSVMLQSIIDQRVSASHLEPCKLLESVTTDDATRERIIVDKLLERGPTCNEILQETMEKIGTFGKGKLLNELYSRLFVPFAELDAEGAKAMVMKQVERAQPLLAGANITELKVMANDTFESASERTLHKVEEQAKQEMLYSSDENFMGTFLEPFARDRGKFGARIAEYQSSLSKLSLTKLFEAASPDSKEIGSIIVSQPFFHLGDFECQPLEKVPIIFLRNLLELARGLRVNVGREKFLTQLGDREVYNAFINWNKTNGGSKSIQEPNNLKDFMNFIFKEMNNAGTPSRESLLRLIRKAYHKPDAILGTTYDETETNISKPVTTPQATSSTLGSSAMDTVDKAVGKVAGLFKSIKSYVSEKPDQKK
jgi:hypothetical protein